MKRMPLSGSELLLMKSIWSFDGDPSVQQLMEAVRENYGKEYKRSSVGTFLTHMMEKGYISTFRKGHYAYIHAEQTREEYSRQKAADELTEWFGGSPAKLVAALVEEGKVTKEEADAIREVLSQVE